jgi:hypothetical protein
MSYSIQQQTALALHLWNYVEGSIFGLDLHDAHVQAGIIDNDLIDARTVILSDACVEFKASVLASDFILSNN